MEPLIVISAGGEGKRLYPITKEVPKPLLDVGNKKLIDLIMEPLPDGIERTVLLKRVKKFEGLERYLRSKYGFHTINILYQDRITTSSYFPVEMSELPLAYYLAFFPTTVSRNSRLLRQFDPIVLVPSDIIVEGLDYLDLIRFHAINNADVTMPVKQGFVRGSNTRIYTVKDGRFIRASDYIDTLDRELAENEQVYAHEGAYVLSRRFFDLPWYKFIKKDHRAPDFTGAFKSLKFVPYEGVFQWIDVRDEHNLAVARERFGKR